MDSGLTDVQVKRLGIPDKFIEHGDVKTLYEHCDLDAEAIVREGLKLAKGLDQRIDDGELGDAEAEIVRNGRLASTAKIAAHLISYVPHFTHREVRASSGSIHLLSSAGLAESRERAKQLILAGEVTRFG